MRITIFLIGMILILPSVTGAAPGPIVPKLTETLSPSIMNATTKYYDVNATFNGTVQLDKLPLVRMVVTLVSGVDTGWASQCSPSSLVITDEGIHTFSCVVVVPVNITAIANVTVDAKASGGGFNVWASAVSLLSVVSTVEKENGTVKPGTTTGGSGTGSPFGSKPLDWTLSITGALALGACVTVAAVVFYKRKK
jgi:hypothetical protein